MLQLYIFWSFQYLGGLSGNSSLSGISRQPFVGVTLTIYVKLLFPLVQENELNWLLRFFMYSSYVVISV